MLWGCLGCLLHAVPNTGVPRLTHVFGVDDTQAMRENVFRPLKHARATFDIFVHSMITSVANNPRADEVRLQLDTSAFLRLRPCRWTAEDQVGNPDPTPLPTVRP